MPAARGPDLTTSLRERAVQALREVAISDPERRYHAYPFEMSGGMCQRVMIAIALACRPSLLIADEPTTGLDVTTQAAVMDLITGLARVRQMATLFITHDLGLAAEYCDRIVVMHAGHAVESAPTGVLFDAAAPSLHRAADLARRRARRRARSQASRRCPATCPTCKRNDLPACRFVERCDRVSEHLPHAIAAARPRCAARACDGVLASAGRAHAAAPTADVIERADV